MAAFVQPDAAAPELASIGNVVQAVAVAAVSSSRSREGRHLGVECDECGENPILGTRLKHTKRRNYDICRQCWQDNHGGVDDGTFCITRTQLSHSQTRQMEPESAQRSVLVYSLKSLADELNQDDTIEDVTFYPQGTMGSADAQAARTAIAQHAGMKTFHIYTRGSYDVDTVVRAVAEGLRDNTSVVSAGFAIATNTRHKHLSKPAVQALQELMHVNQTIKYLFVKRPRALVLEHLNVKTEQDDLEGALFGALPSCSLQTFRFEAHRPVSNDNKKRAWQAMEHNPTLRRICAKFETEDDQLAILTADKKHQWMKRWTRIGSSDIERYQVLEEVRGSDLEEVAVLYRLIRGQPEALLEAQRVVD